MTVHPCYVAAAVLFAVGFAGFLLWLAEWRPHDDEIPPPQPTVDATRWGRR